MAFQSDVTVTFISPYFFNNGCFAFLYFHNWPSPLTIVFFFTEYEMIKRFFNNIDRKSSISNRCYMNIFLYNFLSKVYPNKYTLFVSFWLRVESKSWRVYKSCCIFCAPVGIICAFGDDGTFFSRETILHLLHLLLRTTKGRHEESVWSIYQKLQFYWVKHQQNR